MGVMSRFVPIIKGGISCITLSEAGWARESKVSLLTCKDSRGMAEHRGGGGG